MAEASIVVHVKVVDAGSASLRNYSRASKDAEKNTDSFGAAIRRAARYLVIYRVAMSAWNAVTSTFNTGIEQSSKLVEAQNKNFELFGSQVSKIEAAMAKSNVQLGISRAEATEGVAAFGAFFTTLGKGREEAVDLGLEFQQMASDWASFYNIDTQVAQEKILSGLSGQVRAVRSLGINLYDVTVQQKAAELGMKRLNGEFTFAQKVEARIALLREQSAKSQGDFLRTSHEYANQTRVTSANLKELASTLMGPVKSGLTTGMQLFNSMFTDKQTAEIGKFEQNMYELAITFAKLGGAERSDAVVQYKALIETIKAGDINLHNLSAAVDKLKELGESGINTSRATSTLMRDMRGEFEKFTPMLDQANEKVLTLLSHSEENNQLGALWRRFREQADGAASAVTSMIPLFKEQGLLTQTWSDNMGELDHALTLYLGDAATAEQFTLAYQRAQAMLNAELSRAQRGVDELADLQVRLNFENAVGYELTNKAWRSLGAENAQRIMAYMAKQQELEISERLVRVDYQMTDAMSAVNNGITENMKAMEAQERRARTMAGALEMQRLGTRHLADSIVQSAFQSNNVSFGPYRQELARTVAAAAYATEQAKLFAQVQESFITGNVTGITANPQAAAEKAVSALAEAEGWAGDKVGGGGRSLAERQAEAQATYADQMVSERNRLLQSGLSGAQVDQLLGLWKNQWTTKDGIKTRKRISEQRFTQGGYSLYEDASRNAISKMEALANARASRSDVLNDLWKQGQQGRVQDTPANRALITAQHKSAFHIEQGWRERTYAELDAREAARRQPLVTSTSLSQVRTGIQSGDINTIQVAGATRVSTSSSSRSNIGIEQGTRVVLMLDESGQREFTAYIKTIAENVVAANV